MRRGRPSLCCLVVEPKLSLQDSPPGESDLDVTVILQAGGSDIGDVFRLHPTGLPADRCPQPSRHDGVACGCEPGAYDDGQGLGGGWREFSIHRHRASKRSCVLSSSMGKLGFVYLFARFRFRHLRLRAF